MMDIREFVGPNGASFKLAPGRLPDSVIDKKLASGEWILVEDKPKRGRPKKDKGEDLSEGSDNSEAL